MRRCKEVADAGTARVGSESNSYVRANQATPGAGNVTRKTQISDAGAFSRITAAMDAHDEDRQVQGMACYAIMSAANKETRAAIIEAGAASRIIVPT